MLKPDVQVQGLPEKICKRVKTDEDRQKMNKIYDDIWKHKLPLDEVTHKYFEKTNDLMEAKHNIAYTNKMRKWVRNTTTNNLGKLDKCEVGDTMICSRHTIQDGNTFNVNFQFGIKNQEDQR